MVKHPFVVGFLVAELPTIESETCINTQIDGHSIAVCPSQDECFRAPLNSDGRMWEIQPFTEDLMTKHYRLTVEQMSRAVKISHSLAVAYIMDQVDRLQVIFQYQFEEVEPFINNIMKPWLK